MSIPNNTIDPMRLLPRIVVEAMAKIDALPNERELHFRLVMRSIENCGRAVNDLMWRWYLERFAEDLAKALLAPRSAGGE